MIMDDVINALSGLGGAAAAGNGCNVFKLYVFRAWLRSEFRRLKGYGYD